MYDAGTGVFASFDIVGFHLLCKKTNNLDNGHGKVLTKLAETFAASCTEHD